MTNKELKHLSRKELLELLVEQGKENERLKKIIADQKAQLKDRTIIYEEAGSLAEAALSINEVFQAADDAARQYMINVKKYCDEQKAAIDEMVANTKKETEENVLNEESE